MYSGKIAVPPGGGGIVGINVIIMIVVMNEDQKWFWFENGSYMNEPSLQRFIYSQINIGLCGT
jgi:hypothetical protein